MNSIINVDELIGRPESESSLVRFEDSTDENVTKLKYSVPLPCAFEGRLRMQLNIPSVPWDPAARGGTFILPDIIGDQSSLADRLKKTPVLAKKIINGSVLSEHIGILEKGQAAKILKEKTPYYRFLKPQINEKQVETAEYLNVNEAVIPVAEIEKNATEGKVPFVYRSFGGSTKYRFIREAKDGRSANPRFIIVEKYRLASFFGDYGAGRTIKTFSLWPGEETTFYVRSWQSTEERMKQASSIFDSYTSEAADEFETTLESEYGYNTLTESTSNWKAGGGASLDLGFVSFGGGGGGGGDSHQARETMGKLVANATSHHASMASSHREMEISTEIERTRTTEYEKITERTVKNVNMSRVLNLVCRELNQQFSTYLSLIDVSVAFVNDANVYEEVPLHEIDRLLEKYVSARWPRGPQPRSTGPREYVKQQIFKEISTVYDYKGVAKEFVEEADDHSGNTYWRVKRSTSTDVLNPHYTNGEVPVEGIVISETKNTIRTDAVIVDALLGHGAALDNYALATQQEVLREKQLRNTREELAQKLIESGDKEKLELFKSLFVCCEKE